MTLSVGVVVSLFTALVVTRVLVELAVRARSVRVRPRLLGLAADGRLTGWLAARGPNLLARARWWLAGSLVALVLAGAGLVVRGPSPGLEFTGGRWRVPACPARSCRRPAPATSRSAPGSSTGAPSSASSARSPRPPVRWTFGVAAVLAMFHDVAILLGVFAWLGKPLDGVFLAALLTVIGYSVNDSVVVFDRIRERLRARRREPLAELATRHACRRSRARSIPGSARCSSWSPCSRSAATP